MVDLLRQVTEAPIGGEKLSHEAWHLQAGCHGDTATPNSEGGDERLAELCFERVKKTKTIHIDEGQITVVIVTVDSDSLRQRPIQRLGSVVVLCSERALKPLAGVETPRTSVLP